jgi:hypothetical protein
MHKRKVESFNKRGTQEAMSSERHDSRKSGWRAIEVALVPNSLKVMERAAFRLLGLRAEVKEAIELGEKAIGFK